MTKSRKVHELPFRSLYEELLWANRTVIAASSAAVVGVISGYPFDSIKTRLQTQHYDSINACIKQTYKEEGIRGFFRGVVPPLITVSIIKSISFSVYEQSKRSLRKNYPIDKDTLFSTMFISTTAGSISGALIATLSCPFELVKVQKQLEFLLQASSISTGATVMRTDLKPVVNKTVGAGIPVSPTAIPPTPLTKKRQYATSAFISTSSLASAKEIVKKKGILGLYNGFSLHLVRDTVGTGVYFGGYETTKFILSGHNKQAGPATQFLAGGICGLMCWVVVFPLDLVKTLIQKEILLPKPTYKNAVECVRDIYKKSGLTGFYKGITVTLIRA
ncbi:mitochondrial carrier, partial [Backusella circina FSU 941]